MRLLHVHSGNLYGGVETALCALAGARATPVEHHFALCFDGPVAERLRQSSAAVTILGDVQARQPLAVFRARKRLSELARARAFDATVFHLPWSFGLFGSAAPRPLIFYQHDILHGDSWPERLARRFAPDLVLANSKATGASTARLFPHALPIVLHPPARLGARGVDRDALRESVGVKPGSKAVLIAARFEPWKGHKLLIRALAQLRHREDWVLLIAGAAQRPEEVELLSDIERLTELLGLTERVRFLGQVSAMPELMRACDVYCQPNTSPEPFGLTFVEALDAGLAVIATDMGGASEILSPDYGVLTEPDSDVLAGALERVIGDAYLRGIFGLSGPERAAALCDPDRQSGRLADAIRVLKAQRVAA